MDYTTVFINAIVVALMAVYVYKNEKRMEEIAAKHNQTVNSIISDRGPNPLALERMESKLNETTAILNHHDGILQAILEAEQRENSNYHGPNSLAIEKIESKLNETTTILNRYDGILQEILEAVQRGISEKDYFKRPSKCQEGRPIDCKDIPDKCPSGVYKVFPNGRQGIDVYCEMNLDEGHWTVFQRRENGYTDFYREWKDYKSGFGNPKHEFWLGNEILHSLTSQGKYEMRIDLIDFDGNTAFAKYKEFTIGDESSKFKITANGYYGTAGNSLEHHNGNRFSTKDSDNDNHPSNCATLFPGAWWFNYCLTADLNGQYFQTKPEVNHQGVYWRSWKGDDYSLKGSLMMMRRVSS